MKRTVRIATVPIAKVLAQIPHLRELHTRDSEELKCYERDFRHIFLGYKLRVSSLNFSMFKTKGTTCVCCGLQATYFAIERPRKKEGPCLRLYGIRNGKEIMFTKDHTLPKSKGGSDCLFNVEPMCELCNHTKDDLVPINMNKRR